MRNAKAKKTLMLNSNPVQAFVDPLTTGLQEKRIFSGHFKSYLISLLGTVIEYYDYALYGFCAAILSQHFFGGQSKALLSTYGLFALAAMGKPIGSILFGWLGDYYGRGFVLRKSMIGIAFPTTLIALTPGHQKWGVLSAIVVVVCRFLQGVFVSGENDGVRLYLYESPLGRYPYIANALVIMSMVTGAFLASYAATFALVNRHNWMWRLPFIAGGLLGMFICYFRHRLADHKKKKRSPSSPSSLNIRGILATILLMGASGGAYHLFFVFRPTFLAQISGLLSPGDAQWTTTIALFFFVPSVLISGICAEKVGGRRIIFLGALLLSLLSLIYMDSVVSTLDNCVLLGAYGVAIGMIFSPAFVLIVRQFHPETRFRCTSMGHSLGSLLLSGTAPFMATFLWETFHTPRAFSYHMIVLSLVVLAAITLLNPLPSEEGPLGRA